MLTPVIAQYLYLPIYGTYVHVYDLCSNAIIVLVCVWLFLPFFPAFIDSAICHINTNTTHCTVVPCKVAQWYKREREKKGSIAIADSFFCTVEVMIWLSFSGSHGINLLLLLFPPFPPILSVQWGIKGAKRAFGDHEWHFIISFLQGFFSIAH